MAKAQGHITALYSNKKGICTGVCEKSRVTAAVVAVASLNAVQEKEKSDAQKATKARDAALDALEDWYAEFRELAQIALEDDSQRLEALGLTVA